MTELPNKPVPGAVYGTITTTNGQEIELRYPQATDVDIAQEYINALAAEDLYITIANTTISRDEELDFLLALERGIIRGDKVALVAWHEKKIVGICNIERDTSARDRSRHLATFGISLAHGYRGIGLGHQLSHHTIEAARKSIDHLKIIVLEVYSENTAAIRLYSSLGFVEAGRIAGGVSYKDRFIDKIIMTQHG